LITKDLIASNQWNKSLCSQNWFIEIKFQFGDYVLWFLAVVSKHALKFQRQWFKKTSVQGEGEPKDVAVDEDGFQ